MQRGHTVSKFDLRLLLPSILLALIGIAAAIIVANFYAENSKSTSKIQAARIGNDQSLALSSGLRELDSDTQNLKKSPQIINFIRLQQEPVSNLKLNKTLHPRSIAAEVYFSSVGYAKVDTTGKSPINFAAVDMINQVEANKKIVPEALRQQNRWMIYYVMPVQDNDELLGTLVVTYPLQQILQQLPAHNEQLGEIRLVQKFPGLDEKTLYNVGKAQSGVESIVFATENPYWKLTFTPGSSLLDSGMLETLLIGFGIAFVALLGSYFFWLQRYRHAIQDARDEEVDDFHLSRLKSYSPAPKEHLSGSSLPRPASRTGRAVFTQDLPPEGLILDEISTQPANSPLEQHAKDNNVVLPTDADVFAFLDLDIATENEVESPAMTESQAKAAASVPAEIFRAYDIRGIMNKTLNSEIAYWVGRAIGAESLANDEPNVAVARDGRLSSPELSKALIKGLLESGCNVTDIGMVPTPVLYFATNTLQARSGVMLTGSHNPPDYNGFKVVIAGDTLSGERITALYERIQSNKLSEGHGELHEEEILTRYAKRIIGDVKLKRPLKIVVDCGNGVTGVIAPALYKHMNCTVIPLYCEVDGNFPNHHPDPSKLENVQALIDKVIAEKADIGLAFDGDGDRVGIITNSGKQPFADHLLQVFTRDVLSRNPNAEVIYDVKCSRRVTQVIEANGGKATMWKTGHSLIKAKMKETGALLAGEMSGHIFFKERWYGFDDGLYAGARMLEILASSPATCDQIFDRFPSDASTPEINIHVSENDKFAYIERLKEQGQWGNGKITTIDGIRVDYENGWGLIRASNTTPILVLRFEGATDKDVEQIKALFREQLIEVIPELPVLV